MVDFKNGLMKKERQLTNNKTNIQISKYQSFEKKDLVKDKKLIDQNINKKNLKLSMQEVKIDLMEKFQNQEKV